MTESWKNSSQDGMSRRSVNKLLLAAAVGALVPKGGEALAAPVLDTATQISALKKEIAHVFLQDPKVNTILQTYSRDQLDYLKRVISGSVAVVADKFKISFVQALARKEFVQLAHAHLAHKDTRPSFNPTELDHAKQVLEALMKRAMPEI